MIHPHEVSTTPKCCESPARGRGLISLDSTLSTIFFDNKRDAIKAKESGGMNSAAKKVWVFRLLLLIDGR